MLLINRREHNRLVNRLHLLPPTTKLGQGYIFTGVCDSVHKVGVGLGGCGLLRGGMVWGVPALGGACSGGMCVPGPGGGADGDSPRMATAAGVMHPTGMHAC